MEAITKWLEGIGVDPAQLVADIQFLGLGTAVLRVALGVGTNLEHMSARGVGSWSRGTRRLPV